MYHDSLVSGNLVIDIGRQGRELRTSFYVWLCRSRRLQLFAWCEQREQFVHTQSTLCKMELRAKEKAWNERSLRSAYSALPSSPVVSLSTGCLKISGRSASDTFGT